MRMLALLLGCWLAVNSCVGETVRQATVDGHNDIRRQEAKGEHGSNLYELVWDSDLAHTAQTWANKCNFEHQHIHGQGENIYYAAPYHHDDAYYIHRALTSWMREKSQNSDGSFDCCHSSYTCCHYTQIVASRTKKIGCAVAHCNELHRSGHVISHNAAYVVCDYSPMGNVAVNGHYAAYSKGQPCSACAHGDTCNDGLCVASGH